MSAETPTPTHSRLSSATIAIIASRYNMRYVNGLVSAATAELERLVRDLDVRLFQVPGAFEIPLLAREAAARDDVDAVIALGVIITGETRHADLIGGAVTEALMRIALDYHKPVIHEVLLVTDEAQAERRSLGTDMNRGAEAARAAVETLEALNEARRV